MCDVVILFLHLIVTVVRLARPGGLRSVVAEALVGQLFPAILIGALVAMALQSRPEIVMKAGAATKLSSKVEISHVTRDS